MDEATARWSEQMRGMGFLWSSTGEHWWRDDDGGGDTQIVQYIGDGRWYAEAYREGTDWHWQSSSFDTPVVAAVHAELNNWGR